MRRLAIIVLAVLALAALACRPSLVTGSEPSPAPAGGEPTAAPTGAPQGSPTPTGTRSPETTPVTSLGDPTGPVPVFWSVQTSHRPDGHRLRIEGGTIHAIAGEVRLLDGAGRVAASQPTRLVGASDLGICGGRPRGTFAVDLPLSEGDLQAFTLSGQGSRWPDEYRLEVQVGGVWRPGSPTFAGCASIE